MQYAWANNIFYDAEETQFGTGLYSWNYQPHYRITARSIHVDSRRTFFRGYAAKDTIVHPA
jgi:hypothetical protein